MFTGDVILNQVRDWPRRMVEQNEIWRTHGSVGQAIQRLVVSYYIFRTRALDNVKVTVKTTEATRFTPDQRLKAKFRSSDGK